MLRSVVRTLAFASGAMSGSHRLCNRASLTVVMFHRVMPAERMERLGADPVWTVTPEFLAASVDFFRRHYTIIGLEDIILSRTGAKRLPPRPLLITFDDGWHDNLEWAHPVLRDLPWVLFVATDACAAPGTWWQEVLLWVLRSGHASYDQLRRTADEHATSRGGFGMAGALGLLLAFGAMPADIRERALAPYTSIVPDHGCAVQMLPALNIRQLASEGVAIGAHGASHLPLSRITHPADDLGRAREWLDREVGPSACRALSFPHGQWNSGIAETARRLGFELLFTSDPILNRCPNGWLASDVIGRIPVRSGDLSDRRGRLSPERMAAWLFRRERSSAEATESYA